MMYLLRGSVAGRLVGVVAAGIKCRPYLDSPLTTRMVKLVTSRSLGNCMASDSPVGHLKMDNTSRQSEIDVPSFFTEMNTQKNTVPIRNPKIDNSCRRKKQIDFPEFFTKIKAQMKTHHHKKRIYGQMDGAEKMRIYGPIFTGEVEMRYLEYLDKLPDWNSLQNHVTDYPRRRSENEKRLIFEKWASHYGKKYLSAELKEMSFTCFKIDSLDFIDEVHSKDTGLRLCLPSSSDRLPKIEFVDKWDSEFWVGNMKIMDGKKKIYFPSFFTKMKALPKPDHRMKRIYGPIFTGEVEKRYLEYLKKLDWDSLHKHITDFPRRRSHDEMCLLFDKWAAHYGRLFPSDADVEEGRVQIEENEWGYTHDENKFMLFQHFKHRLMYIDNVNSKHQEGRTLGLDADAVPDHEDLKSLEIPDQTVYTYWADLLFIPYPSFTPPIFCELTGTLDTLEFHYGIEVCYPL